MRIRPALAGLPVLLLAGLAHADDSGSFIVRLGVDTVSVERYTRAAARVEVDQVGRAPRVLRRHFVYQYAGGELARASMVVTAPGTTTPTQTIEVTVGADSLRLKTQSGSAPAQSSSVPMAPGMVLVATSSPWTAYESQILKLVAGRKDSLRAPMYYLGAPSTNWLVVQRRGRDSVAIFNDRGDRYHAKVDKAGRILGVAPIAGTQKFSVNRVLALDLDAQTASYAAREQAGAGLGPLSPRDTVRVNAGGAALWIDYGRPAKRGRVVYGGVVPWGEVWRTGANAATQFKSDKALDFGGTVVPAGFYTLWTLPTAGGWKLIVNGETGQWGTAHNAAKDLFTIDMKTSVLPQLVERFTVGLEPNAEGGVLNLDWDTTRASVAFTVKP